MVAEIDSSAALGMEPRAALPDQRVNLRLMLVVTLAACLAYGVALSADVLPAPGMSVVFFTLAPACAVFGLVVMVAQARAEHDVSLGWVAAGLAAGVPAMALQLISFPAVSAAGGPLGTDDQSNSGLYLLFHVLLVAGAVAGATRVPASLMVPSVLVAWVLTVLVAAGLAPLPVLLRGTSYSALLVRLELGLVVLTAIGLVLWLRRVGATASAPHGLVAVALSLSLYDLLLNALGAERFTAVWWASLSFRVATYLVLSLGVLIATLTRWRDVRSYSRTELDRREAQLGSALETAAGLLSSAQDLSRTIRSGEVGDVMVARACQLAGAQSACVLVHGRDEPLRLLGSQGRRAVAGDRLSVLDRQSLLPAWTATARDSARFLATEEEVRACYPEPDGLPFAEASSLAVLPIAVSEQLIGVLAVWSLLPRQWSGAQRRLLAGLAIQGGQAIARAQAYEEAAAAAQTLQESLLPSRLPTAARVEVAARYVPAIDTQLVGGDWYDCLVVDEHRIALVVGDVMGKGLRAAAQMGQIRMAVRTLIALNPSPAAVLSALDELNLELSDDEIVTLVYVLLDTQAGTALIARAGHLPPLLVPPSGEARFVEAGASTPLGVPLGIRAEAGFDVVPGSLLVLYTDGLVEDRATGVAPGLSSLVTCVADALPEHPAASELAERILDVGRSHAGQDDVAVLVARFT